MAFPTSGYGGTIQTTGSSAKTALNKTLYNKKFLERAINQRVFFDMAQKKSIPHGKNKGDTQQFTRMLPMSAITSKLTEGTVPTDQDFNVMTISVTLEEWGGFVKASSIYDYATFDEGFAELHDVMGQQAGDTLELRARKLYHTEGSMLMRVDNDGTKEKTHVAVTTATSTTAFACSALIGLGDDYFLNCPVTIDDGVGYGQTRICTGFTSSTGAFAFTTAFDTAPTTSSYISVASASGLTATSKLSFSAIKRVRKSLMNAKYMAFDGGWAAAVLSPDTEADLMDDDKFEKLAIYHQSGKQAYFNGQVFDLLGVRWARSTIPYRCAADTPNTYAATGALEIIPFLGKNCFGEIETTKSSIETWFTEARIAEPAMKMYSYLSWKHLGVDAPLNTHWGRGLVCGFTA